MPAKQSDVHAMPAMLQLLAQLLWARDILSVAALAGLVGENKDNVRARLSLLNAVIHVPDDDDEPNLRILHISFCDYLIERAPIRISASLGHETLARACLRVMAEQLYFNVSQSRSSYESNLTTRTATVTPALEYACLQWIYHVALISVPSELDVEIDAVFRSRFLFWLEVLSILGQVSRATKILLLAASTVRLPELSVFFSDAIAFVMSFYEAIERSAPHIYLSALPFSTKTSLVYQTFAPFSNGLISIDMFGIDRHAGRSIMTLKGHKHVVSSVMHSPDGRFIGSGSWDGTVRIWEAHTGEETMSPLQSTDGTVWSVAFAPDSHSLAAGTEGGVVHLCSLQKGGAGRRLSGHTGSVWSVSFSPGGLLASASADRSVRLWHVETGDQVRILERHTGEVRAVVFSPNGEIMASGSDDSTIRLWHVATGTPVGQSLQGDRPIYSISFSPDSRKLVSGGGHRGLSESFSGNDDNSIDLWDLQTRTVCSTLSGHSNLVRCVRFSPDGRSIVSASDDYTVRIWTVPQDMAEHFSIVIDGQMGRIRSVSYSPDGLYIASASDDRSIRIWGSRIVQPAAQPRPAHEREVNSVVAAPCGSLIVSGANDRSVRVWDIGTGELRLAPLLGHKGTVWSVAISLDGCLIASASEDRTVRLWNAHTGQAVGDPLTGHERDVRAVAFSLGTCLASGSDDRTVRIWDTAKHQPSNIAPLSCTGWVYAVTFSPNGQHLAACDSSGRVYLWHADSGQSVREPLQTNGRGVRSVVLAPDGARILAGGEDKMVWIWDIKTGQQLVVLEGHSRWVFSVILLPKRDLVCSGSGDYTVRLWNAASGVLIATLHGHTAPVRSVAFTPDERSILSCCDDGVIRIWDVDAACSLSPGNISDPVMALGTARIKGGWLVGPSGELLLWIPAGYRQYLRSLPCIRLIGKNSIGVTIGGGAWHRGVNWTSCWRGDTLDSIPSIL